ncbi:MAG: NGG1p interacting factor NIF3 [Pseudomonadota bacterium]
MLKISYHVPASHLEDTKRALFDAGAGTLGAYDQCCWQVQGEGQFRPLPGSQPHLGNIDRLTRVPEYRVEMVCAEAFVKQAVNALLAAHPYETPAYEIRQVLVLADLD